LTSTDCGVYGDRMKNILAEMDPIFHPGSAAIVGASGKAGKIGRMFMARFVDTGFRELYAVNPKEKEIMGVKSYPRVLDIPGPVDLAMILTPTASTLQAVKECTEKGVKTIIITTSGFAEAGAKGLELQKEMVRVARSGGCRIIGPNCIGIYCPSSRLPFPLGQSSKSGSVGLVSQSGFFADYATYRLSANGINFSKAVSCGNEADLTATDFLEYLGLDPETEIIVAYMEGVKDGRRFYEVCRGVAKKKPIILWKGGMTEGGAHAALSHTGALAGSGSIWKGMMRQAGIVSVKTFEEVLDCLRTFKLQPLPRGRRVGIISSPGGIAVATTDRCLELGLEVPKFSDSTTEKLRNAMPLVGGSIGNPVDLSIASSVNPQIHGDALRILAEDPQIDMVLLIAVAKGEVLRDIILQAAIGLERNKPIAVTNMAGTEESLGRDLPLFLSAGISVYSDAARGVDSLWRLCEYARFRASRESSAPFTPASGAAATIIEAALRQGRRILSEYESKEVLGAYGVPVTRERLVRDEREFREALGEIGFPLVIKGCGPALAHKTEQGLVYLDIRSEEEALVSFRQVTARFKEGEPAVLVQEMIEGKRELMMGLSRDEQFGPCVMFGLGGILAEILKDTTFRVAPIDNEEALDMMGDIRAGDITGPFRNMPAADIDQLARILVTLGAIGLNHPEIEEIDINPLILSGSRPVAVDALIVLKTERT
jgi:acetate---CoA ligase (ADP-forming)